MAPERRAPGGPITDISFVVSPEPYTGISGPITGYHPAVLTFTVRCEIGLHVRECSRCGKRTPPPTTSQLAEMGSEWLATHHGRNFAPTWREGSWPIDGENYVPDGWGGGALEKLLCPPCLARVDVAVAAALEPDKVDTNPRAEAPAGERRARVARRKKGTRRT